MSTPLEDLADHDDRIKRETVAGIHRWFMEWFRFGAPRDFDAALHRAAGLTPKEGE